LCIPELLCHDHWKCAAGRVPALAAVIRRVIIEMLPVLFLRIVFPRFKGHSSVFLIAKYLELHLLNMADGVVSLWHVERDSGGRRGLRGMGEEISTHNYLIYGTNCRWPSAQVAQWP